MSHNRLSLNEYILRPDFDLQHAAVIEASAGTGKTYQIQTLYLRLVVEVGVPVRHLLVVTFTEAATKELRDRLRAILHACQRELDGTLPSDDADAARVREVIALPLQNRHEALEMATERQLRVRRALMDFDLAAIFTIHGFCHRVLTRYAFECGNEFGLELTTDSRAILDEVCQDWWRRELYPADGVATVVRMAPSFSLKTLAQYAAARLEKPDATFEPAPLDPAEAHEMMLSHAAGLRADVDEVMRRVDEQGDRWTPMATGRTILTALDDAANLLGQKRLRDAVMAVQPLAPVLANPKVGCISWQLPKSVLAFADACKRYVAACPKGLRATSLTWDGGELLVKGETNPEIAAGLAAVRETWAACEAMIVTILQEPDTYPTKSTKGAREIISVAQSLSQLLAESMSGSAADFHTGMKVIADIDTKLPSSISVEQFLPESLRSRLLEIDAMVPRVLSGVLDDIAKSFHKRRLERRMLTFGDLLLDLRAALADPDSGSVLRDILRREFHAGLIDEFQDTDPVQYEIFRRLLVDAGLPVFLVGDPKQAIYGFRSGDIHTYYGAVEHIERRSTSAPSMYSLDTNYRAESALVGAVNAMFKDSDDERVFINAHIEYPGTLKAHGKAPGASLLVNGEVDRCPLKMWYYADESLGGKRGPGKDSPFARRVYADVAEEIVDLLTNPDVLCKGKSLSAGDIAILVLSHAEGDSIYAELARRGVPVVRQKTGNVFDTREAADLAMLLLAMATPSDVTSVRSAMATSLMDVTDDEILAMEAGEYVRASGDSSSGDDGHSFDDYLDIFRTANERWRRRSFVEAFNYVARRTRMRVHLVRQPEGERRLTNVLQLVELIHHAATEQQLGLEGCIHWLRRQCDPVAREQSDAYEMRLETDDSAVRIMTVFRSKGLQFPVVFVPTMWRRAPMIRGAAAYHHRPSETPDTPDTLVVDLAPDDEAKGLAMQEMLEEDIRLFYVAVTRAVNRVYVVWGNLGGDAGPLRRVLDDGPLAIATAAAAATTERTRLYEPEALAAREEPAVGGVELWKRGLDGVPGLRRYMKPDRLLDSADMQTVDAREDQHVVVDKSFGHSSFTGLTARHGASHGHADYYDFDAADEVEDDDEPVLPVAPIFQFPAGARTGECWHRIFEKLDFSLLHPDAGEDDRDKARAVVTEQLDVFGLCKRVAAPESQSRKHSVIQMVEQTLQLPLPDGEGTGFRLCDVVAADRMAEFTFDFPLARWTTDDAPKTMAAVVDAITAHWPADPAEPWREVFTRRLQELGSGFGDMRVPRGYMTGSIDLFFRHDGRYYIADWKSNKRGGTPGDFDAAGLYEEMADHLYFLQYLIYTVAAHQYLRGVMGSEYNYDRDFGGAYYVFLRAVDMTNPARGVFHDRPPRALVEALGAVIGDFGSGGRG